MEEQVTFVRSGDFIEFGTSGLYRFHRTEKDCSEFKSRREVLAVSNDHAQTYSVVYADESGLCSSAYVSLSGGVSFFSKKDKASSEKAVSASEVPSYKWGDLTTTATRLLKVINGTEGNSHNNIGRWLRSISSNLFTHIELESLFTATRIYQATMVSDGKVALFLNQKDFDRSRSTTMKAGRAFRHMFQNMSDAQVAKITDLWMDETAPRNFKLRTGRTIDDFHIAYTEERTKSRNLSATKNDYKSLAMSCMHTFTLRALHEGEDRDLSPASVYASGDFEIAYVVEEDEEGNIERIAGRVIYSVGTFCETYKEIIDSFNAPIYAACEQSGQILRDHLAKLGCLSSNTLREWDGLRLLLIEAAHYDTYIAPYFDGNICCDIGSTYLNLDINGSYELTSTEGLLKDPQRCNHCDCEVHEDEVYYDEDGYSLCESCYCDNHATCSVSGETFHINDLVEARQESDGSISHEYVHMDYARYCECVEQWWFEDDVTLTQDGEYVPNCKIDLYPELFTDEVQEVA